MEEFITITSDDGTEEHYKITPLRARAGLRMATRLLALASPIAGAAGTIKGGKSVADATLDDVDHGAFAGVVRQVAGALIAEVEGGLLEELIATVCVRKYNEAKGGERLIKLEGAVFDVHFQNNYGALVELVIAVLNRNFGRLWERYLGNARLPSPAEMLGAMAPRRRARREVVPNPKG